MLMMPFAINQVDIQAPVNLASPVCEYEVVTKSWRNRSELLWPWLSRSVSTLEQANDRTAAYSQLAEISRLKPNWDGYEADPIDAVCIANVQRLLDSLPFTAPSPDITPNPNGTLTLDWQIDDQAVSLEIGATRFSSFWESRTGTKMQEATLDTSIPNFVVMALDSMFPDLAQTQPLFEGFALGAGRTSGFVTAFC